MITDPKLIILRGLPGSGKSTYAQVFVKKGYKHFEADMFFELDGEYKHDPSRIKEAHKWCQDQVSNAIFAGHNVVVSNTFVKLWEIEPYLNLTGETTVVKCVGEYPNIHGVPIEVIKRMKENWQNFKGEFIYGR